MLVEVHLHHTGLVMAFKIFHEKRSITLLARFLKGHTCILSWRVNVNSNIQNKKYIRY